MYTLYIYVVILTQDEYNIYLCYYTESEERPRMSSHSNKHTIQMYTWVINCLFPKGLYQSMLFVELQVAIMASIVLISYIYQEERMY